MVSGKFRGVLFLATAAALISGLCVYKLTRTYEPVAAANTPLSLQPAPPFELLDSKKPSELVRLKTYLGRHRIVLVFFDAAAGADHDPNLLRLRADYELLKSTGTVVVGVSPALPQENRKVFKRSGDFPFSLLSDPDLRVHELWGRYNNETKAAQPGLFLIDRKGDVAWADGFPRPLDPERLFDQLTPES